MRNLLKMFLILATVAFLFGCAEKTEEEAPAEGEATEEAAE